MRGARVSESPLAYSGTGWRLVEAQHRVSTLKLVETLAEQALLEHILEETKPPLPPDCAGLDYLLATPFRYRPYPHGSRFRRAGLTPGVWYGAERAETAVAEMVFYRYLFYAESPSTPFPTNAADYTGFSVPLAAMAFDVTGLDDPSFYHPTDYAACQSFADQAREAQAGLIRYTSIRDPKRGANLAVLSCQAFAARAPKARQTWRIRIGANGGQALCDYPRTGLEYARSAFADPRLEGMVWER